MYTDFRTALQSEGVRSCLPHLQDSDLPAAIEEYYRIRDYDAYEKRYGVLALRLGDFRPSPFRPLSRTEISSLQKILTPQKCLQYLTKIASGSFAHVYKFKRYQGSVHSPSWLLTSLPPLLTSLRSPLLTSQHLFSSSHLYYTLYRFMSANGGSNQQQTDTNNPTNSCENAQVEYY